MRVLTLREINRATLARQMLLSRERVPPLEVIGRLVGMQAQWPRPPFVGLWSRLQGFEREQLVSLLTARRAVRATFLRATIHLVRADDYLALRPALQPALTGAMGSILKQRLDGLDLDRLVADARRLLSREPQTFDALRRRFLQADPKADERAMGYAVRMLLPLVQVPDAAAPWAFPAQACFTPADRWLGRDIPVRPALPDELIRRYLAAYGPATAADVQAWAGLGKGVREALDRMRPELDVLRDERRRELFDLPGAPHPGGDAPAPVRLIPEYDNLVATRADERIVATVHRPRVFLSALRIAATVLVDGFAAATWKLQATKTKATITIEPFAGLTARVRKEVAAEAHALVRFAEPAARAHDVKVL